MLKTMRRFRSSFAVLLIVLAAIALASCGGGGDESSNEPSSEEREQIMTTFKGLQRAFAKNDYTGICDRSTLNAQERAGDAAHGLGAQCDTNLERFFELIRAGGSFKPTNPQPKVVAIEKAGEGATVTVKLPGKDPTDLPFVQQGGVWQLDSLFGVSAGQAKRYASSIRNASFPPPAGAPVKVTGKDGAPCPAFKEKFNADRRTVTGGCAFDITSGYLPITVSTAFGDFDFADCTFLFQMRVDGSGRTWTPQTGLGARGGGTSACGDVYGCTSDPAVDERNPGLEWPMRGQLAADGKGGFVQRISLCWETCVGVFTGDMQIRITRQGDKLRAEAVDTKAGTSGFRFEGPMKVTPGAIDIVAS